MTANATLAAPREDTAERLWFIRQGVSACWVDALARRLGSTRKRVCNDLALPYAMVGRKCARGQNLTPAQSERVIGAFDLLGTVDQIVQESGDPTGFDAGRWLGGWIQVPARVLGGDRPASYLSTVTGQAFLRTLLLRAQAGVYS
jgi:hypothetical protein